MVDFLLRNWKIRSVRKVKLAVFRRQAYSCFRICQGLVYPLQKIVLQVSTASAFDLPTMTGGVAELFSVPGFALCVTKDCKIKSLEGDCYYTVYSGFGKTSLNISIRLYENQRHISFGNT